jgi:hypothetical protein
MAGKVAGLKCSGRKACHVSDETALRIAHFVNGTINALTGKKNLRSHSGMDEKLAFQFELSGQSSRSVWELICQLRFEKKADSPRLASKSEARKIADHSWRSDGQPANYLTG